MLRAGRRAEPELQRFVRRSGVISRRSMGAQFRTAGAEFGSRWKPLQEVTIRRFKKQNQTLINVRTRNLFLSVTQRRAERLRGTGPSQSLVLVSDAVAASGGATLTVVENDPRGDNIRHPVTGIAGRGLRELNEEFERFVRRITKRF